MTHTFVMLEYNLYVIIDCNFASFIILCEMVQQFSQEIIKRLMSKI
jgi:hypothetical protein